MTVFKNIATLSILNSKMLFWSILNAYKKTRARLKYTKCIFEKMGSLKVQVRDLSHTHIKTFSEIAFRERGAPKCCHNLFLRSVTTIGATPGGSTSFRPPKKVLQIHKTARPLHFHAPDPCDPCVFLRFIDFRLPGPKMAPKWLQREHPNGRILTSLRNIPDPNQFQ